MVKQFSPEEWKNIWTEFDSNAGDYGLPDRRYGSVLLASFNIRKLGAVGSRNNNEWGFLINIIRAFDLIAIQEVGDNLSGLRYIMDELGPDYGLVVSDQTGVYPGVKGNLERLAFVYRWSAVSRREVASDITFDRSKVLELIADNLDGISQAMSGYTQRRKRWQQGQGSKPKSISASRHSHPKVPRPPYIPLAKPNFGGFDYVCYFYLTLIIYVLVNLNNFCNPLRHLLIIIDTPSKFLGKRGRY